MTNKKEVVENEMDTVLKRALHYVECYDLHWPDSGAKWVVEELKEEIEKAGLEKDQLREVLIEALE